LIETKSDRDRAGGLPGNFFRLVWRQSEPEIFSGAVLRREGAEGEKLVEPAFAGMTRLGGLGDKIQGFGCGWGWFWVALAWHPARSRGEYGADGLTGNFFRGFWREKRSGNFPDVRRNFMKKICTG